MTTPFLEQYRAFAANGGGRAPAWLKELRERGIARFAEAGFPTTRQEEWRFTSVAAIVETPFTAAASRWTVSAPDLPRGAVAAPLADAVAAHGDLVREHLGRHADVGANPFTALATAFCGDGVFVHVPAGVEAPRPISVACRMGGSGTPMAAPRLLVVLGDNAAATLIETYDDGGAARSLTNAVTEVVLGAGARLEHVRVQREGAGAFHVATTQYVQGKDTTLRSTSAVFGAALARHDINAVLAGTGGSLVLNGLSVIGGTQHADLHTSIEHAQPHCESHELFNGIFAERARGVFNGRIVVRPGAQKTDSKQTNNNLLLSAEARADSQPQLEIYADDVKCTHGSTVGPLDPATVFYLRSRGIGLEEARGLLTYGFGADVIERIAAADARAELDALVRARLGVAERRAA